MLSGAKDRHWILLFRNKWQDQYNKILFKKIKYPWITLSIKYGNSINPSINLRLSRFFSPILWWYFTEKSLCVFYCVCFFYFLELIRSPLQLNLFPSCPLTLMFSLFPLDTGGFYIMYTIMSQFRIDHNKTNYESCYQRKPWVFLDENYV